MAAERSVGYLRNKGRPFHPRGCHMYQALWLGDNHRGRVIETLDLQFSGKVKAHSVRLDNMLGRLLVRPSTEHASASSEASAAQEKTYGTHGIVL